MKTKFNLLLMPLILLAVSLPVFAQTIDCPDCVPLQASEPVETWYRVFEANRRQPTAAEIELAERIKGSSVRIYQGNGCGTGSLCGRDDQYIYILSNAHVASTRIGSVSRCQAIVNGRMEQFSAEVIETAYSTRYRTDWSLLRAPARHMAGIEPVLLYAAMPNRNEITVTWGHPACRPTEGQATDTVQLSTVWYWLPNSRGGQSGSAKVQLVNGTPVQVGLLTWTERLSTGWVGSGQFIKTIKDQSENRTNVGEMRTGLETPVVYPMNPLGVELSEGYGSIQDGPVDVGYRIDGRNPLGVHLDDKWASAGNQREVSLRNYPIWYDPSSVPPVDEEEEGEDEEENEDEDQDEIEPAPPEPKWMFRKRADVLIATDGTHIVTIIGDVEEFLKELQKCYYEKLIK